RRSICVTLPSVLGTMLTPKSVELVAYPFCRGGRERATAFFERGFARVFQHIRCRTIPDVPPTVFYAFKQSETNEEGIASTGWEVLLQSLTTSGWVISGTWPIRTERPGRMRDNASNALASSVVLACRPRPEDAPLVTRRAFLAALKDELP